MITVTQSNIFQFERLFEVHYVYSLNLFLREESTADKRVKTSLFT